METSENRADWGLGTRGPDPIIAAPYLHFAQLQSKYKSISFPEHARSQVKGGHSSGEIELI
jgi:hypothetical protein